MKFSIKDTILLSPDLQAKMMPRFLLITPDTLHSRVRHTLTHAEGAGAVRSRSRPQREEPRLQEPGTECEAVCPVRPRN